MTNGVLLCLMIALALASANFKGAANKRVVVATEEIAEEGGEI